MRKLLAGSRGSKLALIQTKQVIDLLDCEVDIKKISTRGDKISDVALTSIKGKGFFTREIDEALLAGEIDLAVHSLKDLPTDFPEGIVLGAIPQRETANDAIVGPYNSLESIPKNAVIGTSSIRRKAEILRHRSDLQVKDLRGNLDTRINKLNRGDYDAIIVSEAGLLRLGYSEYSPLSANYFIPAVCQGALGITVRSDDKSLLNYLSKIEDLPTKVACEAERAYLSTIGAGCQIPAGAHSNLDVITKKYKIHGFISSLDGQKFIESEKECHVNEAKKCAVELAKDLLASGDKIILKSLNECG
ncbi:MAG: hydroxymethylbilane synthase [Candidatus Thorarchaeota archaeon]